MDDFPEGQTTDPQLGASPPPFGTRQPSFAPATQNGQSGTVRLEAEPGKAIQEVFLFLTPSEAKELRDTLDQLLAAGDPNRHEHVSSADYQTEVTVMVSEA